MKHWIVFCLLAVSCKKSDPAAADAGAIIVERAIVPSGGCSTSLTDEQTECKGQLGGKLDKYTWKVTKAGNWDVVVTQPKEIGGFRAVVLVWTEPDKTVNQGDSPQVGAAVHATGKLEPGSYRISVINGSKSMEPPPTEGYPYALTITRAP